MSTDGRFLLTPRPGPALAATLSIAAVAVCAAAYWQGGGSLEAVRLVDRLTAWGAAVLFCALFSASALAALLPNPWTIGLLVQRRNLALAFAAVFGLHLMAVARVYALDPKLFLSLSPPLLIVLRAIGVAFILVMLVDLRPVLGAAPARLLTILGGWYVWAAFLNGFLKRASGQPLYLVPVALLVLVLGLRVAAAWLFRQATRPPAPEA